MKADTAIINAKVVLYSDVVEAGIAIAGGRIVSIGKEAVLPKAEKTIDAKGNLVMPGVIDAHVHTPVGHTSREDFTSLTEAAAVGGVTLAGIMPQGEVLTENRESFRCNKAAYDNKSIVDFSLLGAFSGGEGKDFSRFIPELWQEGAIAIKGYMHNHRPHRILKASYDGEMLWALEQIAKVGGIANVHCENEWMQTWNKERMMRENRCDAEAYLKYAPPIVEYEAGKRFLYYCKVTGARGMTVHTSLPELVMEVQNGKKEGYPVYVETCPHYLYFTENDFRKKGAWFKCAPTLRDRERVGRMWEMLDKGYVDTIGSDHVPEDRSVIEEVQEKGDMFMPVGGMPHIEHILNALMNGVNSGRTNLLNAIKSLTINPAKIYGLYPKKGTIQIGSDADLVIVDMNKELKITRDSLITKAGWSAFEGMTLKGNPVLTMVRGEIVVRDRQVVGRAGHGQFVSRLS